MSYDIVSMVPAYCDVFTGHTQMEGGVAFSEHLERELLDYSVDSLHALDRYLDVVHQQESELSEQSYNTVVITAGSYLGEVIRRNASCSYRWVNYHDYFNNQPQLADVFPETLGTLALLEVSNTDKMTLPINKIVRYIEEGPENNTHYYASVEIKQK